MNPITTTPRILRGDNPFNVDPSEDFLVKPEKMPNWSETHFASVWDPKHEVGIFIHAGVCQQDVGLWWAQVFIYLPNRVVISDMSWGRAKDNRGPCTGNLTFQCVEPFKRWIARFDGAGEKTTTDLMGTRLVGADVAVPVKFDIEFDAINPPWDMFKATDGGAAIFAHIHNEQHMLSRGSLIVDGKTWQIDGCSFRDHSAGPRNFAGFGHVHWLGVVFPKSRRALMGLYFADREGRVAMDTGYITDKDTMELTNEVEITGLDDTIGNPTQLTASMRRPNGEKLVIHGEVLHCATFMAMEPNINLNGVGHLDKDPIILTESVVKFTMPDGEVGYGNLERDWRWVDLPKKHI